MKRVLNAGVLAARGWLERAGEITPGTRAADRFGSFGADSSIGFPSATLMGTRAIHLGTGVLVGRQVTLSVGYGPDDPNLPERGLVIGDRSVIGARCSIVAHLSVGEQFGAHQPVRIGSGTWIGHGAIILPGAQIGRNVTVAAGSVVRGEVADHTVVGGAPARLLRRLEPGVGWVGTRGDVRPVLRGHFGGAEETGFETPA